MINVIVVEDHALFRTGLIAILEESNEIFVVGEYHDGKKFIEAIELNSLPLADIIFLDISMPWLSGLEVLQAIENKGYIVPPICMLSMYPEQFYLSQVKEHGARGYINKDSNIKELREAIDVIIKGGTAYSDKMNERREISLDGYLENLSAREIEVFKLLAQGMTVKEIAFELKISVKTISTYKSRLMEKLGADSLSDLLRLALMYEE